MDIQIKKSLLLSAKIRKAWLNMEKEELVSPYLYYNFMKYVWWQTKLFSKYRPIIFYAVDKDNNIVMIAPMKVHIFSGKIDTLGNIGMCDMTDFLYRKELSDNECKKCLLKLRDFIGRPFYLSRLLSDSKTLQYLKPYSKIVDSHECVDIFLESDYESHFKQLSKSVRQNIRTAYNRMQKDSVDFDFHFYIGGKKIPAKIKRDSKRCYLKRQLDTYTHSVLTKLKHYIGISWLRHDNFSLFLNDNAVNATLYLNGVVAACFMGSLNYSKDRVVIPRLAISADFRKYSPGYVLLCECMKYVLSKTSIQHIDLCRGTEKYKSDLGGDKYLTLFVEIQ